MMAGGASGGEALPQLRASEEMSKTSAMQLSSQLLPAAAAAACCSQQFEMVQPC